MNRKVNGTWTPLSTTLTRTSSGYSYDSGNAQTTIAADATSSDLAVTTGHGHTLRVGHVTAAGRHVASRVTASTGDSPAAAPARVNGLDATYAAAAGGADVQVKPVTDGVEFTLHIADASQIPADGWDVAVDLNGLSPTAAGDGFSLLDTDGSYAGYISPVLVHDSSQPTPRLDVFTETLSTTAAGTVLHIAPDTAWLNDPATTYPLTVDPVLGTTDSTNGADTFLWSAHPYDNYGGDPWLYAGVYPGGGVMRSVINFNNGDILNRGYTVQSAQVGLGNAESYACHTGVGSDQAPRLAIQRITNGFYAAATTNWSNGSGSIAGTDVSSTYASYSEPKNCAGAGGVPGDLVYYDITPTVVGWANGSYPNDGLQLITNESNAASFRQFRSGDASGSTQDGATAINRGQPVLRVTYESNQKPPVSNVTAAVPHSNYVSLSWSASGTTPQNAADSYLIGIYNAANNALLGSVSVGAITTAGIQTYNASGGGTGTLVNGQNVTFTVYAHNSAGYAAVGTGKTAQLQGNPSRVYGPDGNPGTAPAVSSGDGTITATWAPGTFAGGTLQDYISFLYTPGQHWPATAVAYCVTTTPSATFNGTSPAGSSCSGPAPADGSLYDVEVFQQNFSGDTYTGSDTDNTATGGGVGGPSTTAATLVGLPGGSPSVAAVAGNGGAIVYWTPSPDNGNGINTYTVTAAPGGATVTTDGDVIAGFPGLTNGTSYTFTVTPTNSIGNGTTSAPSNAVVPSATGLNITTTLATAWAVNFAQTYGARVPIPSLATATSNTFAEADGTLTTEISPTTTQVTANDGSQIALDANLVQDGATYRPSVSALGVTISSGGGTQIDTISDPAGHTATFSWPTTLPAPMVNGDTATYPNAALNTDLLVTSLPDGVDHSLSIKAAGTSSYTMHLDVSSGLTASLDSGSNLIIADAFGNIVYSGPPATMHDSQISTDSDEPTNPGQVTTSLTPSATGGYDITVTPDASYLLAGTTVYPVTIDPPVTSNQDTYLQKASPKTAQGGNKVLKAGTYNGGSDIARPLLQFIVSAFAGKSISSAQLQLTNTHSWQCASKPVTVYRVTGPWKSSTATWSGDGETPAIDSGNGIVSQPFAAGDTCASGPAPVKLPVTAIVQAWAGGTPNYGFEIRSDETDNTAWKVFASTEAGGDQAPKLLISTAAPASPPPPAGKPTMPAPTKKPTSTASWGIDTGSPAASSYPSLKSYYTQKSLGGLPPDIYGRYLDGTINGNATAVTAADISYVHSVKSHVLIVDSYFNDSRSRPSGNNDPVRSTYASGLYDGQTAISHAKKLADSKNHKVVAQGTTIFADIEGGTSVDSGWVKGWYAAFKADKFYFRPGYYYNASDDDGASSKGVFGSAYCGAAAADSTNNIAAGEIDKNSDLWVAAYGNRTSPTGRSAAPKIGTVSRLHCPGKFSPSSPGTWQYSTSNSPQVDENVTNGKLGLT